MHFREPSPLVDLADSPFRVAAELTPWPDDPAGRPRLAGVSAFGVGGTNVHVVLEQAPPPVAAAPDAAARPTSRTPSAPPPGTPPVGRPALLVLSARTPAALAAARADLAGRLGELVDATPAARPAVDLADVAFTLQAGRDEYDHRWALVADDLAGARAALARGRGGLGARPSTPVAPAFLFPGAGAQHDRMGRDLYESEPVYREQIDSCAEILRPILGADLRELLYGPDATLTADRAAGPAFDRPDRAPVGFAALVATELALARTVLAAGIRPRALLGHSLGEYTAACLAGVLSVADTLTLVVERERLMRLAGGVSIGVALAPAVARDYLATGGGEVVLACVNSPSSVTLSGPERAVAAVEAALVADGVDFTRLQVPTAVHSPVLDAILPRYAEALAGVTLHEPTIPYLSNLTGTWITAAQATDPGYWLAHTREPGRFADNLVELRRGGRIVVEVGPGRALCSLAGANTDSDVEAVPLMRHRREQVPDDATLLAAVGRLWTQGVGVDWAALGRPGTGRRVSLPGYPFQRRRFWLDPPPRVRPGTGSGGAGVSGGAEPGGLAPVGGVPAAQDTWITGQETSARARATLREASPELDADLTELCARHAGAFLRRGGVDTRAGTTHRVGDVLTTLRVIPKFRRFALALLQLLDTAGFTTTPTTGADATDAADATVTFTRDPSLEDTRAALAAAILARAPEYAVDLRVLDQCVARYPEVFAGEIEGHQVLLPDGVTDISQAAVDRQVALSDVQVYLPLVARTVAMLAAQAGPRGLRVLEVGAGRGYLTWEVAEALRGLPGVSFHFTDLGRSFVLTGRREAAARGLDFMTFGQFDVGADPVAQGLAPGGYDVVLGFNVLHATPDLHATTANLTTLLAPGGQLFVVEAVRQRPWALLTAGLYDGWWLYDDDLRDLSRCSPRGPGRTCCAAMGSPTR
ncbi:acyltransferase domain-containing protein [Candidatus Frankia nodulisporulans]|uniref:acyltransferase domain-containing protein n=2 Tax=Candidatus Frankia nodulisporulans TaxID=2060052 RepID=UPI001CDBB94A|nr:acyltransferase domain-containing protein [Candidatus Frankia nodulisporulans]